MKSFKAMREARLAGDKYTVYKDGKVLKPKLTKAAAMKLAKEKDAEYGTSAWVSDKLNENSQTGDIE
jgi:hypothetical protein